MAEAASSRGGSSKTEVSVSSNTLPSEDQTEQLKRRAHRASLARHSRKCTVCHHPEREFIDQDYLRWLSPKKIAREYGISHHSVVYRHAHATGLLIERRTALRATLEHFIEQAASVRATAGSVVAAVRLYAQINDQGQYTPPVHRNIVEHLYRENSHARSSKGTSPEIKPSRRSPAPSISNREPLGLEHAAN